MIFLTEPSPLHLHELHLDIPSLYRWVPRRSEVSRDINYLTHSVLCASLSNPPHPFVLFPRGNTLKVLGYSHAPLSEESFSLAEPFARNVFLDFRSVPFPELDLGVRVRFRVTCVPSKRLSRSGKEVPLDLCASLSWFRERMKGFHITNCTIKGAERFKGIRSRHDGSFARTGPLSAVTFTGSAEVADREGFNRTLRRGVGRHRAFGFGAVLLSPGGNTSL